MLSNLALVALGGAVGASGRYLSGLAVTRLVGHEFPWGTLLVNVLGCLAMGLFIGWLARRDIPLGPAYLLIATGVLGGFTTFSAFSLDAVTLWERGQTLAAFSYVTMSVVVSISALFAGLFLMRVPG